MIPKLVPACQTPAKAGTVFVTNSENVKQSRARVEEDLLIDHPIDCPICDKAGECRLQDYHFAHGQNERRADIRPFTSRRRELGGTVTLFVDRCVMCTRCVRFTREISGSKELFVINRGSDEEIDVFPGYPLANKMSGNVVDLCPVGALGDKDFLYQQRVWFMKSRPNVLRGLLDRLLDRSRCESRHGVSASPARECVHQQMVDVRRRPLWLPSRPRSRAADGSSAARRREGRTGKVCKCRVVRVAAGIGWQAASGGAIGRRDFAAFDRGRSVFAGEVGPAIRSAGGAALGPVPVVGEDERFASGFTIHAEKCPNRKGVEAVLLKFTGGITSFADLVNRAEAGEFQAVWITGGYHAPWIDEATAARFANVPLLIVQDLFDSPLNRIATYQLPGASFAERFGSYVNFADRLQSFEWAIRPPAGVWVEGELYWRLLGAAGMFQRAA